ncbi:hypothetical protein J2S97_003423 [Arthrobacter oryzae]|nr:hypothetical protein [Arthrobacter oryzae]
MEDLIFPVMMGLLAFALLSLIEVVAIWWSLR